MANSTHNKQGGTHEQQVKTGSQSHKNQPQSAGSNTRGGGREQHAKAGSQSHKNR